MPGFSQKTLSAARAFTIGAGGIISWLACGLVRKGIGTLHVCDGDAVELSNLSRQLFGARDVGKNKAVRLARNLRAQGFCGTRLTAYPLRFEELVALEIMPAVDLVVVGVDDHAARLAVMRWCAAARKPAVFIAVSPDADNGYVFVYKPGAACLCCVLPDLVRLGEEGRRPCPGAPATLDVLLSVAGFATYAIDSLLMERPRSWNFRRVFLSGDGEDCAWAVPQQPACPVCSGEDVP